MDTDPIWHGLKFGDWATWAGAVGSILAASAAAFAAIQAIRSSKQADASRAREREDAARAIAPAIGMELRRAGQQAAEFSNRINWCIGNGSISTLVDWLGKGFLIRTAMLERSLDKFDVFGVAAGAALSAAAASTIDFRSRMAEWRARALHLTHTRATEEQIAEMRLLDAEALMISRRVGQIGPILEKFGGGKTEYEA